MASSNGTILTLRSPTPTHPPYFLMISEALVSLNEKEGSTESSISEHIKKSFEGLPPGHDKLLPYYINKLIKEGEIVHGLDGRYLLPQHKKLEEPMNLSPAKIRRKRCTKGKGTSESLKSENGRQPRRRRRRRRRSRIEPSQEDDISVNLLESKHDDDIGGRASVKRNKVKRVKQIYSELSDGNVAQNLETNYESGN